jgi:cytidine deaminase
MLFLSITSRGLEMYGHSCAKQNAQISIQKKERAVDYLMQEKYNGAPYPCGVCVQHVALFISRQERITATIPEKEAPLLEEQVFCRIR